MKAFEVIEACDNKNYMINLTHDFHKENPKFVLNCSYGILAARLMGLSYPNYLLYCQSKGGTIKGRVGFPYVVFKEKVKAEEICSRINSEWNKVKEKISYSR